MDEPQEKRLENELSKQNRSVALLQTIVTIIGVLVGIVVTVGQPLYNLSVNQKLAEARIAVLESKVQGFEKSQNELVRATNDILIKLVRIEGKLDNEKR